MKPLGFKNYGSIPHLSNSKLGIGDHFIHEGQERILTVKERDKNDVILAFEKYDGTNVGIAKKEGQIIALTRSGFLADTSPYLQHHIFSDWVFKNSYWLDDILKEGERLCAEWLIQAHGLKYKITREPILFFDFFNKDNKRKPFECLEQTNLPLVRMLHKGSAVSVESLLPILNEKTIGVESEEKPEGIVFRVERNNNVDFLAKWVRSDFEAGKYIIGVDEKDLIYNCKYFGFI